MIIQRILFPKIGKCTEDDLYFHRKNIGNLSVDFNKSLLTFKNRGCVWFDTYFNGLSAEKWKKYTIVDNVSLNLTLKGKFKLTLLQKEKIHDDIIETVLDIRTIETNKKSIFNIDFIGGELKGMYTFGLEALEDDSIFYGGEYCSDVENEKIRDVKIGLCICTFKRESFIEKNLKLLNEAIIENKKSDMYGRLEVFISDNGKTLDYDRLSNDKIHIYKNKNCGGAGGFTRDLIEIYNNNDKYEITHPLLMDDDVTIEPEALVKTYKLLSLIKDEYKETFIGGAMLRRDLQYKQVENGAVWNGGYLNSLKSGLDLRTCDACLYNEIEEFVEYNAWWYCCFPMNIVKNDNLPLPLFIQGDDLEYGLRNMKKLITMNGICSWHEPFENKYSSSSEYYIMRNRLIDNSFHCRWFGAKQAMKITLGHSIREIGLYRYKNVDLYLQGIEDFLKGPEWLLKQDSEVLHKKIMAAGYKGQDLDTLDVPFSYPQYDENRRHVDGKWRIWFRWLLLNGLFLPTQGDTCVPMANAKMTQTYRKKRVLQYDITSKKGFVTEKSIRLSCKYFFKALGLTLKLPFVLSGAQEAYRTKGLELRTIKFWTEYLGINN